MLSTSVELCRTEEMIRIEKLARAKYMHWLEWFWHRQTETLCKNIYSKWGLSHHKISCDAHSICGLSEIAWRISYYSVVFFTC
jgi:hypothetical protein